MDLSGRTQVYPCVDRRRVGNHHQQHQYVNDWHKAPSSRHTAAIDLSAAAHRPLAPVYHCNVPAVISQTQASGIIVTADEWQPFSCKSTTWSADSRCGQYLNIANVAASTDRIYEIPSDDDTRLDTEEEGLLVIDEYVNSSADDGIDSNEKEQLTDENLERASGQEREKLLQKESKPRTSKEANSPSKKLRLKDFVLKKVKTFGNKSRSLKNKILLKAHHTKLKVSSQKEKKHQVEYKVKSTACGSPLKLILSKSSKGNKNAKLQEPAAAEKAAASSSSEGLAKCSRPAKPEEHKYEQKNSSSREQNGKQTTCKSSPNKSRKEGKSHDSTKKPAVPNKNDEPEEMKQHRSSPLAEMSETKHASRDANKRKKPVLSDRELCRKFNCKKQVRVMLKRMTKEQIRRHTHPLSRSLPKIPKIKYKPAPLCAKIDSRLKANVLMDSLLGPRQTAKAPKIIFAPRGVVKCHNKAAPPAVAPLPAKQKGHRRRKVEVPSKTFPKEMIGLLERDIERALPLQRFINDEKRHPKLDWMVLDGKMQYSLHQRAPLRNDVKIKVLLPPQLSVRDLKAEYDEQLAARAAAIARIEKKPPNKVQGASSLFRPLEAPECCSKEDKQQLSEKVATASSMNFLELFPTPKAGLERQQELLPNHWHTKILSAPYQMGQYLLRGVNPVSREFEYVAAKFNKSCKQRVLAVDKVENPHLWFRYQLKKEKMEQRNPFAHEFHMFHGTDKEYLDSILSYNLDWKCFGRKKGSRFGHGYYFSPLSSYALHYTDQNPNHSIMLLFRLLTVKQCVGFEDTDLPDDGFDTCVSENGKVWVKFDIDEVYPDYVVHFAYSDPEEKADVFGKHRAKLVKKEADKWKKNYKEYMIWNSFRQRLQRRPMTWRKFYMRVKKWKLNPLKPRKGSKLKAGVWRGPLQQVTCVRPPNTKAKLEKTRFKSMAVWKQPKKWRPRKVAGSYRAKKRNNPQQVHNFPVNFGCV